ncbi:hypothetical protein DFH29DRAFT_881617 [Suillus ampliporus]|nr:hypothetical protein DFH29DRAFT_881617 [Suillus ampliporus]
MAPKKRTKHSYESTQGQGGHAEQLKKAGETLAAAARKKTILDISDAEENPMAPSQLRKSKKNATTEKPTQCSVGVNRNVNSGHQHSSASLRPVPSTAHSSGRFGFQQPMSTSSQSIRKAPQSSDRTCEESRRQATERDIDVDRQDQYQANGENEQRDRVQDEILETAGDTMDSGQHTDDLGSGNEGGAQEDLNYGDDELDAGDDEFDAGDDELDAGNDELDAGDDLNQGIDGDYNDEPDAQENYDGFDNATGEKSEESVLTLVLTFTLSHSLQDGVYDVLERHQTKNGKRKAPSPAYLSRVKHVERRRDSGHSKSPQRVVSARSSALVRPPIRLQISVLRRLIDTHLNVLPPTCTLVIQHVQGLQFDVLRRLLDTHLSVLPPACTHIIQHIQGLQFDVLCHLLDTHLSVLPPACSLLVGVLHLGQALPPVVHCTTPDEPDSRSKKQKVKTVQEDPAKLGFYPPAWQAFLQVAKLEMCLQAVLTHPIPQHRDALQLAQEVLNAELWVYHENQIKLDKGYFLQYVAQMSRLLCDNLFTFRTELKKVVISIAKTSYEIFLKGTGKWKNFVLQALRDSCLDFYYSNSKKALKNMDEFQRAIPINGLLLVAAVMKGIITGFRETGTDKVPDLSADKCRANFNSLRKSVDTLMDNIDRCVELEEMLQQWAMVGMGDLDFDGGSVGGSDMEDVNVVL